MEALPYLAYLADAKKIVNLNVKRLTGTHAYGLS